MGKKDRPKWYVQQFQGDACVMAGDGELICRMFGSPADARRNAEEIVAAHNSTRAAQLACAKGVIAELEAKVAELERNADADTEPDDSMDGDAGSALASAGHGTDEDYGGYEQEPDEQ